MAIEKAYRLMEDKMVQSALNLHTNSFTSDPVQFNVLEERNDAQFGGFQKGRPKFYSYSENPDQSILSGGLKFKLNKIKTEEQQNANRYYPDSTQQLHHSNFQNARQHHDDTAPKSSRMSPGSYHNAFPMIYEPLRSPSRDKHFEKKTPELRSRSHLPRDSPSNSPNNIYSFPSKNQLKTTHENRSFQTVFKILPQRASFNVEEEHKTRIHNTASKDTTLPNNQQSTEMINLASTVGNYAGNENTMNWREHIQLYNLPSEMESNHTAISIASSNSNQIFNNSPPGSPRNVMGNI